MIIVDAGPLVALIDKGQTDTHEKCLAALRSLSSPLLTSWPCLAEAMYLLGKLRGWEGQKALWNYLEAKTLVIYSLSEPESARMRVLMERYANVPMDLADASLVVIAETTGLRQAFTLDDDFYIYRINDLDSFEVVPLNEGV
ncbi:MAG: hypothetical protein JMDDDDMK_02015 [Acidobacteria bacterium]|nr:hypothetical protein [Acidobacteriota bacterium]